jgi:hypothetical protein
MVSFKKCRCLSLTGRIDRGINPASLHHPFEIKIRLPVSDQVNFFSVQVSLFLFKPQINSFSTDFNDFCFQTQP